MRVQDLRKISSVIFNREELTSKYGFDVSQPDKSAYDLYQKFGVESLKDIDGEFACVWEDEATNIVFAIRDWIGETSLHYIITGDTIYFANFISELIEQVPAAKYNQIIALNRSEYLIANTSTGAVTKKLYYNFNDDTAGVDYSDLNAVAETVHDLLFEATEKRVAAANSKTALLLSGGIDSMSVAFMVSRFRQDIPAYTISVASQISTDLERAKNISKKFGIEHRIISVSAKDVLNSVVDSVKDSEIYHMYNVFCAVGMHKLAQILQEQGTRYVFTGEGGNEAFGDYHDWIVRDPQTKQPLVLQKTAAEFEEPVGREAYIWGNLKAEETGRYNIQLGSGLGKHGGSRMYKPMFKRGITLLSPYLDRRVMKVLANIPGGQLRELGGKPGFMKMVFAKEIASGEMPADFFEVKKIRFQDASEEGSGGITETLLVHGYNQAKLIEIFNEVFKANIVERKHLKETILVQ